MTEDEPQTLIQWHEAIRWLGRAREDLRVARILIGEEGVVGAVGFHVQQAVEKILKALLVAAAADIRRSHDIEELAVLANRHWPDLVPLPFALAPATRWYIASRYPGIDDVGPSTDEVELALGQADALLAEVSLRVPQPVKRQPPCR